MRKGPLTFAGSLLVVVALVAAGAAPAANAATGGRAAPPAAGGFSTEALWSAGNDWEPSVAAAPGSSYVYEATTRYGTKSCAGMKHCIVVRSSANSGSSWSGDTVMCATCQGVQAQNDPVLKVATDGRVYAVWRNDWDVMFARSADQGATWTAPVALRTGTGLKFTDKPWLAISPSGQDVY